jgi:phosphohistidine phosphatase
MDTGEQIRGGGQVKILYLNRHAKSSWDNNAISDFDRPLNKRGKTDAPLMGKYLAQKRRISPEIVISSPAKRAIKTAEIIAKEIGFPSSKILRNENIYEAGPSSILEIIQNINDTFSSAMLFGHNPGFTSLASYLSNVNIGNMPTCGICRIDFDTDSWKKIEIESGTLVFFDYPKKVLDIY